MTDNSTEDILSAALKSAQCTEVHIIEELRLIASGAVSDDVPFPLPFWMRGILNAAADIIEARQWRN